MIDTKTISVYDARDEDYAKLNEKLYELPELEEFAVQLPAGGRVLDLGCGPGQYAGKLAAWGYEVDATDASAKMVARAASHSGVTAWQARFDELDVVGVYDGVWANFSLLHIRKAELPGVLARIRRAGKPGMTLHVAVKLGEGEGPDAIGRFYAYYGANELTGLLQEAGFSIVTRRFGEGAGLSGETAKHVSMLCRG
ncbi:class I SAM-dependent methyltransferase [Marimonas arenosa]|uniref:Methyltransferase domain-containing protein n=1 Tax=Marimonas arenosa TaxID=1795305 RepID=A0AAE3WDK1_9RHOB|nr:class I SAM-dependent methyltransferase [Marimonas arenosa]MDQ2090747.1 methyltransferase domain-containing protein [Marimonas arenosa]